MQIWGLKGGIIPNNALLHIMWTIQRSTNTILKTTFSLLHFLTGDSPLYHKHISYHQSFSSHFFWITMLFPEKNASVKSAPTHYSFSHQICLVLTKSLRKWSWCNIINKLAFQYLSHTLMDTLGQILQRYFNSWTREDYREAGSNQPSCDYMTQGRASHSALHTVVL